MEDIVWESGDDFLPIDLNLLIFTKNVFDKYIMKIAIS
jgi:hypothetical protein